MAICWERAVPLAFHLCCFYFSTVLIIVGVLFPFGVWGRIWNSVVSVPDHCLFIYSAGVCNWYSIEYSSHNILQTLKLVPF